MKLRFLGQAVLQGAGLVYATIKYEKKDINNVNSYMPEVSYALPFAEEW